MTFIPCKDDISYNEIEDAKPEHITVGCNVLLHAMLERAGGYDLPSGTKYEANWPLAPVFIAQEAPDLGANRALSSSKY